MLALDTSKDAGEVTPDTGAHLDAAETVSDARVEPLPSSASARKDDCLSGIICAERSDHTFLPVYVEGYRDRLQWKWHCRARSTSSATGRIDML